jgi:DNA-binding phage protein
MSTNQTNPNLSRSLTVPFRELVEKRVRREPAFAAALLEEAVERLMANDVVIAQLLLRDVVNGTIGFPELAHATGLLEKSLMRMLSAKGNPQAKNLFQIIRELQVSNAVRLEVRAIPREA